MVDVADASPRALFRGAFIWTGVAFALVGYGGEWAFDGRLAFEAFALFGGLFIGIGYERNRQTQARASAARNERRA